MQDGHWWVMIGVRVYSIYDSKEEAMEAKKAL